MDIMTWKRVLLTLLFLALFLSPATAAHQWKNLRWPTPVIKVRDGLHRAHVRAVLADWTGPVRFRYQRVPLERCHRHPRTALRRAPNGFLTLCRWPGAENPFWVGWAGVKTGPGGFIERALAGMGPGAGRATLCHEVGHALGLDHREETGTCMNFGPRPDAHDLEQLEEMYR